MIMRTFLASCILLVGLVSLGRSTALAEPAKEPANAGKPPATSTPQEDAVLGQLLGRLKMNLPELETELYKARMDFEIAKLAKQEYVEGTYVLEKQTMELEILLSRERARRAQREVERIKQLAKGGEAAACDVEDSEFGFAEAQMRANIAKTKRRILEEITKPRTIAQLDRDFHAAETHLKKLERLCGVVQEQLKELQARSAKPAAEKAPPASKGHD
jgi:hypothetical protein